MSPAPVYGLVLAGGASRRMQRDKAALEYQGQSQLQRAYELLRTHCAQTFVSIRAEQQYDALRSRWPQIVDQHPDLGPLAGIVAAQATHPHVAWLVIACDLPLLTEGTITTLLQQRDVARLATVYRSGDGLPEPLCAIWEPASVKPLQDALAAGEFSPRALLQKWPILLLDAPEPEALRNVNTPDEYQHASATLTASSKLELQLQYFAILREQAGKRGETLSTTATTPSQLYAELQQRYGFKLTAAQLKVAINNEFCEWQQALKSGDVITFIPPVAGG
jgi:molybdopterin-guanine dinucleotide biosynthesis protein A